MDVARESSRLAALLADRHPLFAPQTVERLVRRIFEEFEDAPVRAFLPILVQREAGRRLRDLDADFVRPGVAARAHGTDPAVDGAVSA